MRKVAGSLFLLFAAVVFAQPVTHDPNRAPAIRLKSRTIHPERGVDPALLREKAARRHVLLQFDVVPSLEERNRLLDVSKIVILDAIPERAFFAAVPAGSDALKRIAQMKNIRWIGAIQPRDKIAPELVRYGPPDHARRGKGRAEYLIEFFGDVGVVAQRKALDERGIKGGEAITPLNGWRVTMRDDLVETLAADDRVKWIAPLPEPPTLDNDGVRSPTGVNSDAAFAPAAINLTGTGVVVGQWEPTRPSTTHGDLTGRVTMGVTPVQPRERELFHTESVAANGQYDVGEAIYADMDDQGTVTVGDFRAIATGAFLAGSTVAAGNADIGTALTLFLNTENYRDADNDDLYDPGETWYREAAAFNFRVDVGEQRLNAFGATPPGVVAAGDPDVNLSLYTQNDILGHVTHVACTALGTGARSAMLGGAANQWKGVATGATLRAYLSSFAGINNSYVDAGMNAVAISTNSWGNTHCHEQPVTGCYNSNSELYDAVASGRQSSGMPSGVAQRITIFGSSGNTGRPERHAEGVAVNGLYDDGEAIYIDFDDSGTASVGDTRRTATGGFPVNTIVNPGNADIGTVLVNFLQNERHVDAASGTGAGVYASTEPVYRDNDNSGTVTVGDTRINTASGFPAGSVVAAGNADLTTFIRYFRMWGNVRVPNSSKNTIAVANYTSDTTAASASTSRGPTADGRIKPDVAGPGSQAAGDFSVWSCAPQNLYNGRTGTSMSTPAVAGSGALLTEWYRTACLAAGPLPEVVRALLTHTATDRTAIPATPGVFTGPDFAAGYGSANVKVAADLIAHNRQGSFAAVGNQDTTFTIGRVQPLKVTLAWDDVPQTANAAPSAVIGLLQNDLDLLLIAPDGTQYTPWQVNVNNPAAPATSTSTPMGMPVPAAAVDHRNNLEQVVVPDAMPGTWTVRVAASTLNMPPQGYTIISEHLPPQAGACTPAPAADVWMQDNGMDLTGAVPSAGTMWQSPAIWNRNGPDGMTGHQNPIHGIMVPVPNYLYADVRNTAASPIARAARIDVWIAQAALGLAWPINFTYVGSIPVANLGAGATTQVGPLLWYPPDPTPTTHFCLYARVHGPQDPITLAETANLDFNARNSNNIVWKNVNIMALSSNTASFFVRNIEQKDAAVDIVVRVDPAFLKDGGSVRTMLPASLERAWRKRGAKAEGFRIRQQSVRPADPRLDEDPREPRSEMEVSEPVAAIRAIPMGAREAAPMTLTFSRKATGSTKRYKVEVVELIDGREVGGIAYELVEGEHK